MLLHNRSAGAKVLPNVEGHEKVTVPGKGTAAVDPKYWREIQDNPAVQAWRKAGHLMVEADEPKPAPKAEPSQPAGDDVKPEADEPKAETQVSSDDTSAGSKRSKRGGGKGRG